MARVEIFYDLGSKVYGIREIHDIREDCVHLEATKSITMTYEQLDKIIKDAKDFVRERGKM